jgi:trans-aconitate methyltransferase
LLNAKSILDIGCGRGHFGKLLRQTYKGRLDGIDIVSYEGLCADAYDHLIFTNLNAPAIDINSVLYDMIFAIEVIEHLENPRAFFRFCTSILKSRGKLIVTTPNVISVASLLTFICQGHFRDFRNGIGMYPAHLSPVIPLDAERIALESGLRMISIDYSNDGRIPFTTKTYQRFFPFLKGKLFSDNYRIVAMKP